MASCNSLSLNRNLGSRGCLELIRRKPSRVLKIIKHFIPNHKHKSSLYDSLKATISV